GPSDPHAARLRAQHSKPAVATHLEITDLPYPGGWHRRSERRRLARQSSRTNVTSRTTWNAVTAPSVTSTVCSLIHAPETLRNVWLARSTPVRTASSKLVVERALMVVMRAIEPMVVLLSRAVARRASDACLSTFALPVPRRNREPARRGTMDVALHPSTAEPSPACPRSPTPRSPRASV